MNKDFRVAVGFPTHPKAMKLIRRCGFEGYYCLTRLWAYVAMNKPDGILDGVDGDDIEIASGWAGECSSLLQALLDLRLIEQCDGGFIIHDWAEWNGFACHAEERSDKARKAAEAKWSKKKTSENMQEDATSNACSTQRAMHANATSYAPSPSPSPSPSPTPTPTEDTPPVYGTPNPPFEQLQPAQKKRAKANTENEHRFTDDPRLHEAIVKFSDMRRKMRKPMTDEAVRLTLVELEKLAPGNTDQQVRIIEQSIMRGWQGVFQLKDDRPSQHNQPNQPPDFDRMRQMAREGRL